jgi:hypothetical protein
MPSKRTLASNSSLDSIEARKVLASIKRDLRRVRRDVQALQPVANAEPEQPISWDVDLEDSEKTDKLHTQN